MKRLAVISSGRADYGLLRPVMTAISDSKDLQLLLFVTGAHLSPEYGETAKEIEDDGFCIDERVYNITNANTPQSVSASMGLITAEFSRVFARTKPDMLLVLGDRFEIFAATAAAVPMRIATAHIHGGESTLGSIDETFRHCLTKMSHLHFVSCDSYARRVIQLGEEPWRVTVSGAPGLDNIKNISPYSPPEFYQNFGIPLLDDSIVVTFHPESVHPQKTSWHIDELLTALERTGNPIVFTYPNADAAGKVIIAALERYCKSHEKAWLVASLGTRAYVTLMSKAAAMVGNSSSGIIEAASFKLPVVNLGSRQDGRLKPPNVIDVPIESRALTKAIARATSSAFRSSLQSLKNPFGDGRAASRIVRVLEKTELNERLLIKRFHDLQTSQGAVLCG